MQNVGRAASAVAKDIESGAAKADPTKTPRSSIADHAEAMI
jgi:hypothetical protein